MDDLNTKTEQQQAPEETGPASPPPRSTRRRYLIIVALVLAVLLIAAAVVRREDARNGDAPLPQSSVSRSSDVIEATPEQLKQIRVEAVHQTFMDLDLETSGKVGLHQHSITLFSSPSPCCL